MTYSLSFIYLKESSPTPAPPLVWVMKMSLRDHRPKQSPLQGETLRGFTCGSQ